MIPSGNYIPSISKRDAQFFLEAAKKSYLEGFESSKKLIDDMFLKL